MAEQAKQGQEQGAKSLIEELPLDRVTDELKNVAGAFGQRMVGWVGDQVSNATDKLNNVAGGGSEIVGKATEEAGEAMSEGSSPIKTAFKAAKGGLSGAKDKVTQAFGGGGGGDGDGGGGDVFKATNIVEEIDIGAPLSVVYNQWTQYEDLPDFLKKVENVEQEEDAKTSWRAQVLWSHRQWEASVLEQVPDEKILWRSEGEKGHVDGCITFHELAPRLTRVVVVLEYYPQGFFEKTGNLWRAQGRRVRLELKHFRRHVMMNVMHGDELEGWRGEIHDGEVTRSHEEVVEAEQAESEESEEPEEEYEEEEEPEEEYEEEEEAEEEPEEEEPEEEYEEEDEPEEEEEPEEEPAPRRRRRGRS